MAESTLSKEIESYKFKDFFDSRFSHVYYNNELKIILCELKAEYVPIEHFKDTFYRIEELVSSGINHKLILDKRSLKAFHQPSMEWYFVHWKKNMYNKGLKVYRKILPPEAWFRAAVINAREQILREYPHNIIDRLDIKYCESIQEAIET